MSGIEVAGWLYSIGWLIAAGFAVLVILLYVAALVIIKFWEPWTEHKRHMRWVQERRVMYPWQARKWAEWDRDHERDCRFRHPPRKET